MDDVATVRIAVVDILSEVLTETPEALRAQPVLAAHAWDSLASLEALAQLENRFSVVLDLRDYHAARQIDDLVGLVVAAGTSTSVTKA